MSYGAHKPRLSTNLLCEFGPLSSQSTTHSGYGTAIVDGHVVSKVALLDVKGNEAQLDDVAFGHDERPAAVQVVLVLVRVVGGGEGAGRRGHLVDAGGLAAELVLVVEAVLVAVALLVFGEALGRDTVHLVAVYGVGRAVRDARHGRNRRYWRENQIFHRKSISACKFFFSNPSAGLKFQYF